MSTLGKESQWSVERTGLAAPALLCVEPGEWANWRLGGAGSVSPFLCLEPGEWAIWCLGGADSVAPVFGTRACCIYMKT